MPLYLAVVHKKRILPRFILGSKTVIKALPKWNKASRVTLNASDNRLYTRVKDTLTGDSKTSALQLRITILNQLSNIEANYER